MIKNSQRQKEKRKAAKWLQTLIGDDWGIRVLPRNADKPRPVHANSNERSRSGTFPWRLAESPANQRTRRNDRLAVGLTG